MVHAVVSKFNSRLALKSVHDLHKSAEPLGQEQSPPNHPCYGVYFPANLRCYSPSMLTQPGSPFGLASVLSLQEKMMGHLTTLEKCEKSNSK